jgi:hypothetical protein
MFRSSTIIRELVLCLAKIMLEHSVKLRPYRLCGGAAACLGVACVLCAVQNVVCLLCAVQNETMDFRMHGATIKFLKHYLD